MRKSCNLELELRLSSSDECSSSPHHQSSQDLQQQQQLTIFYSGVMCVSDVTELQARAILCAANNEIGETVVKISTIPSPSPSGSYELSSPSLHYSPLCSSRVSARGLSSMKKSLQKFLQKRKHRSQATHPYHRRIVN
ncbi:putative transcription factor TIFY family [Rosa chinensis]|uniref:Protein TIFY n=1 Tax=Rosa chinensis TaxID=74649 RepID=A0A2P6Q5Q1_ROSCH|nr:protein TIFY 5A [Rosa chinensis]PRQ29484.1 putative transcription factor TIFY family [Rosa chinensis]